VFIGGYFYDPFFGPYPWWPHPAYPYWYHPVWDDRAEVKISCPQRHAAVYVDGFYAGVVDDFDGMFQSLPLPPGGHRIALYLAGYATREFSVYLQPGATFTLRHAMERLVPGELSENPAVSPPVPAPPEGTYTAPRGTPPVPSGPLPPPAANLSVGVAEISVQPATAVVMVDGERWMSSEPGHYDLQLPVGVHRLEVSAPGYRTFTGEVDVRDGATTPINVSLVRGSED
jgi:hypothetical protein